MKKILYISILAFALACNDEIVEGPAMAFYPTNVQEALEEDGIPYQVTLNATGELPGGGVIQIDITNHEFIKTVPAHENGKLLVQVASSGSATFTVEALDDDLPNDYVSNFRVTDTGGAITGIADSEYNFIVKDDDTAIVFGEDFEDGDLDNWEIENIGNGNDWRTGSFSGNTYADISNFNSNGITESWLLSPEIDFASGDNEILTFETQPRFNEGVETFEAYVVTGYTPGSNPANATLTQLSFEIDDHTGAGFGNFAGSGEIDLSGITTAGRIAFYYKAGNSSDGSGWSVDNVFLQSFHPDNSDGIPNDNTGGGNGGGSTSCEGGIGDILNEDFESQSIPNSWTVESEAGINVWEIDDFDDNYYAKITGFSGSATERDWLISPQVTLPEAATFEFSVQQAFATHEGITVLYSNDFDGSDILSASWIDLEVSIPMGDTGGFESGFTCFAADISDLAAGSYYFAFRYDGGTDGDNTGRYHIDDVKISTN